MTRWIALLLATAVVALGGCAHPISLQSDTGVLVHTGEGKKIDRKVALAVSDAQKSREVITPGGGGDKVSYYPYRDLETGLYVALSETFSGVTRISGPSDAKLAQEGAGLVFVPEITTNSHSPSLFTWPPTIFLIDIEMAVRTPAGAPVAQLKVQGEGRAEFDEFKSDFSLSAKRAAQDALRKLIKSLQDSADKFR